MGLSLDWSGCWHRYFYQGCYGIIAEDQCILHQRPLLLPLWRVSLLVLFVLTVQQYSVGQPLSQPVFLFSVQLGIQTLPSLLSGELFPSDVRAFGKGLTRSATCGFMLISLKVYPILSANLGVHGTFFLFSVVLLLSLPIVYCILPETKDMGLEMIPSYFTPNKTIFYVDLTEPNSKPEQQKNPEIIA